MPLKIRYLTGPYAGREIEIDDERDEVRFGRGMDADIPFPDEMVSVSRQHFGLRREYGGYKFIINQEKPVFLNGAPVLDGQDLPRSGELQLSGPAGPRLKIDREDGYGSNQQKTEILQASANVADKLRDHAGSARRSTGVLIATILALIAVGGAGYWLWRGTQEDVAVAGAAIRDTQAMAAQTREAVEALQAETPGIKAQLAGLNEQVDVAALVERVKGSVYQVAFETKTGSLMPMGTSWVVRLPDGRKALATNAHVAELFDEAKTPAWNGRMLAIEPKAPDYRRFVVTGIRKHPAYDEWAAFVQAYYERVAGNEVRHVALPIGYDVALLYVDDPAALGEPLEIATPARMEALKAGERVVELGYPSENVLGTDVARPEPTSNNGMITSMTSFFLSSGEASDRQFIQHNAAGAGGSSGSAMFDAAGKVIGLHNAGNYIFIPTGPGENDWERVPSAGNINYGQRADLLLELMNGKAEERLAKVYRPQWIAAEKEFSRPADAVIEDQVAALGQLGGGADKVSVWASHEGEMSAAEPLADGKRAVSFDVDPPQGAYYLFVAEAADGRNIGLAVVRRADGGLFAYGGRGSSASTYLIQYDVAMPTRIAVFDDSGKPGPAGKIKLTIYAAPAPEATQPGG